ncbi:hypothetical protein [Corallococcus exiguus]|uniref:Delta-60 repeat domain-containing protein n=1 Tax=Corallococcus exiguus TaxID=83462 RepID=A0A7X4YF68_9BACT|nr:hypothetical protein [Corallococcus exiguus]NBC44328.1 hypothetical protein [Corallococcus exiguus]TNV66770.1 hypothetical protein FH620_04530 [Corallococcus exiguus]
MRSNLLSLFAFVTAALVPAPVLYAQTQSAPFVLRLDMQGNKDRNFNNGSYSVLVNIRPDRVVYANNFLVESASTKTYLSGHISTITSPVVSKPFVVSLEENRLNLPYGAPDGFVELDPRAQAFTRFENFSSVLTTNNSVALFGAAVRSESEFYPFSSRLTNVGHLDNSYREGGTFLMLDCANCRIKSVDANANFQAGVLESYTPEISYKVFSSQLNGASVVVGTDVVQKLNDPIARIYQDNVFVAATTRASATDFIRDGGLTLAKFDRAGKLVAEFGSNGKASIPITSGKFTPQTIAFQGNAIYVGGKLGEKGLAVIKLKADGTLDESFGGDGISVKYMVGSNIQYGDLVVGPLGVYISGSYGKAAFVTKLNPDGSYDQSWGVVGTMECSDLSDWFGSSIPIDKVEQMTPFKIALVGSGISQRIVVAGNAQVRR